jgi:hypothetical protein
MAEKRPAKYDKKLDLPPELNEYEKYDWPHVLALVGLAVTAMAAPPRQRGQNAQLHAVWLCRDIRVNEPLEIGVRRRGRTNFTQHILQYLRNKDGYERSLIWCRDGDALIKHLRPRAQDVAIAGLAALLPLPDGALDQAIAGEMLAFGLALARYRFGMRRLLLRDPVCCSVSRQPRNSISPDPATVFLGSSIASDDHPWARWTLRKCQKSCSAKARLARTLVLVLPRCPCCGNLRQTGSRAEWVTPDVGVLDTDSDIRIG